MELDAHRSIATGDMTHRACWKASTVSIRQPPSHCGRLHNEQRIALCKEWHNRLAPAAVMWKFDDVGAEKRTACGTIRDKVHRGDSLDVTSQKKRTDPMRRDFVDGRTNVAGFRGDQ